MADVAVPLQVSVVYSPRAREVDERVLPLPAGSTVRDAIAASGVLNAHPEIDLGNAAAFAVSLWGRKTTPGHALRDGDRIEICRALLVDPKVARRERFQKQGVGRAGLFATRRPGGKAGY